jgi:hypothetical protein
MGPGMRSVAEKMCRQREPVFKSHKGLKSVTFVGDGASGEYGGFSTWERKEDADAHLALTRPNLQEALKDMVKEPPTTKVFEVFGT